MPGCLSADGALFIITVIQPTFLYQRYVMFGNALFSAMFLVSQLVMLSSNPAPIRHSTQLNMT